MLTIKRRRLEYQLSASDRRAIDGFESRQRSLLVLTRYNDTARSLRAFFNRRLPLWEGHTRSGLEKLVSVMCASEGNSIALADAVVEFMGDVGKGFSPSAFGDRFKEEVRGACTAVCSGKPALIQELAQFLIREANHRGVSRMLRRLSELRNTDSRFATIEIDCRSEFWEAIRLSDYESANDGLAQITHKRTYSQPHPQDKAISTIHKAKGLECGSVILMPCDDQNFPDKLDARCLLYVALSRAKNNLLLVVPHARPSPLLAI